MEKLKLPEEVKKILEYHANGDYIYNYDEKDLDNARRKALDAINYYKEIKSHIKEQKERKNIFFGFLAHFDEE